MINGIITERGKSHFYRFDAKEGERLVFHAESMKLGYHLDPTLTIFDSEGKKQAYADDPGMDDRSDEYQLDPDLSFTPPRAGTWYVASRDGMSRGGDQLLYRLTASRTAPDFIVELRDPLKTIYAGGDGTCRFAFAGERVGMYLSRCHWRVCLRASPQKLRLPLQRIPL